MRSAATDCRLALLSCLLPLATNDRNKALYTGCPTTYPTRQFFNNFTTNEDIAQLGAHYRHIPLHFSPTNVLLFKSPCNIFIGLGITKELPGLVRSGTLYIILYYVMLYYAILYYVILSYVILYYVISYLPSPVFSLNILLLLTYLLPYLLHGSESFLRS
jgi:hypothetical protein